MLDTVAGYASNLTCILALAAICIKPIRDRILGMEAIREGQRCLLRSEIVRTYYRNLDTRQMREYEYANLSQCYKAYKQLNGNSFIEHIYTEMQEWTVVQ